MNKTDIHISFYAFDLCIFIHVFLHIVHEFWETLVYMSMLALALRFLVVVVVVKYMYL